MNRIILVAVLSATLLISVLFSIAVGQYHIELDRVFGILAGGPGQKGVAESVVWNIRLPRLILGIAVGAGLGVAGALMQAVFANPLAEPAVIGVTSGAGVGAAVAIVFNLTFFGTSTVAICAFLTAVLTTLIVYRMARFQGRVQVINLILTGIAINAVAGAIISFMLYLAPTTSREQIIFWQMGSLNGSQWKHVQVVIPIIIIGILLATFLGKQLDTLALGEKAAGHIGINVHRLRIIAIGCATLLTAAAVAYAGLIGFVGLIIPHLLRSVTGPSNRILIPASALGGAVLISIADIVARTIIPFADLPIGIFTALVGGPTFFILLRRMLRKGSH
ncbi:MAG: iron ABC transporter permease [Corynebacterium sp.]|nr:iron ABC transporter permease [Corynebacterium sp.]